MSLQVIGRLHIIGQTEQVTDNFRKRDFIIEISDETPSGIVYTNYAKFQLANNYCTALDNFQTGTLVKVSFQLRGKMINKKDGGVDCFTNLNAWRVESHNPTSYAQPQQNYQPQQPAQNYQQQQQPNKEDDLPF